METGDRGNLGTIYFPIAFGALVYYYWSQPVLMVASMMPLTWGDAMAATLGQRYGHYRYTFGRTTRSLEGSLGMLFWSWITTSLALLVTPYLVGRPPIHWLLALMYGGLVALGANIVNMAVVGPVVGLVCFKTVRRILPEKWALAPGSFVAGWVSLEAGALLAGLQIGLSGTLPTVKAMTAMGSVHAVIGILEGILTAVVIQMLHARRPDLLMGINHQPDVNRPIGVGANITLVAGGVLSLVLAATVIHLASDAPDGLEHVLESSGVKEGAPWLTAPMPDYRFPWLRGWIGKSLAGFFGVLGTAGLVAFALRLSRPGAGAAKPDPSRDPSEER